MNIDHPTAVVTFASASIVGSRIAIHDITAPTLVNLLDIWSARRCARRYPDRSQISPRDMASFLRNITLFSITPDRKDFEYRIMGDGAVVAWGRSFQGLRRADLNRITPEMGDVILRLCAWVAEHKEPLVLRGTLWKHGGQQMQQETLFLPLGPDDETVDHILSLGNYATKPAFAS